MQFLSVSTVPKDLKFAKFSKDTDNFTEREIVELMGMGTVILRFKKKNI
jgi:hypothetical protein